MKFRANHDIVVGKPGALRTVASGGLLPKLAVPELQRLADLGAVTAIDDGQDDEAEKAAADKAATEQGGPKD